jgi:hypothetical protein
MTMRTITPSLHDLPRKRRRCVMKAIGRATAADRRWFQAYPFRQTYIRPAFRNEISEAQPGQLWYVAVRQIRPGVRQRWGFKWFGEALSEAMIQGEEISATIFELCAENPGGFNSGRAIADRLLSRVLAVAPAAGTA